MPDVIPVFVYARDPISQAGMASQLRSRVELRVGEDMEVDAASVAGDVDGEALRAIKAIQRNGCPRVVAVITSLDDGGLLAAVEAGACGLLRRSESTPDELAGRLRPAGGGGGGPPPR